MKGGVWQKYDTHFMYNLKGVDSMEVCYVWFVPIFKRVFCVDLYVIVDNLLL